MDVDLMSNQDLCRELLKRYDHVIITGMILRNDGDVSEIRHCKGNHRICQGLAMGAIAHIERHVEGNIVRPLEEDEE